MNKMFSKHMTFDSLPKSVYPINLPNWFGYYLAYEKILKKWLIAKWVLDKHGKRWEGGYDIGEYIPFPLENIEDIS